MASTGAACCPLVAANPCKQWKFIWNSKDFQMNSQRQVRIWSEFPEGIQNEFRSYKYLRGNHWRFSKRIQKVFKNILQKLFKRNWQKKKTSYYVGRVFPGYSERIRSEYSKVNLNFNAMMWKINNVKKKR